MRWIDSMMV
jgi:hypothetical protein